MALYTFYFLLGGRLDHVETFELYNDTHASQLAQARSPRLDVEVWQADYFVCRVATLDEVEKERHLKAA